MLIEKDYKSISFDGAYDDGNNIYVSCEVFNGMLKMNKETLKANYVCKFSDKRANALCLHRKVYKYKRSLIFVPDNARGVHIYNLENDEMRYHAIDSDKIERVRCIDSFLVEDKLWLIYAYAEHPIVIIDLTMEKVEFFYEVQEKIPREISTDKREIFWSALGRYQNKIYGVVWNREYIMEIDTVLRKVSFYKVGNEAYRLCAITYDGSSFWLVESERKYVIKWNSQQGIDMIYKSSAGVADLKSSSCNIFFNSGKILLLFNDSQNVYWINEKTNRMEIFCEFPYDFYKFADIRKSWRTFFSYDVIGDIIRIYPTSANMMLDIDVVNRTVKGYQFVLDEKYDDDWYRRTFVYPQIEEENQGKVLRETKQLALKDYIGFVGWR